MGRKKAQHVGRIANRQALTTTSTDSKTRKLMAELKRQESALASETAKSTRLAELHESSKITQNLRLREIQFEAEKKKKAFRKAKDRLDKEMRSHNEKLRVLVESSQLEENPEQKLEEERYKTAQILKKNNKLVKKHFLKEAKNNPRVLDSLECDICSSKYTRANRPVCLSCGHTVCYACTKSLQTPSKKIRCTVDGIKTYRSQCRVNHTLLNLV